VRVRVAHTDNLINKEIILIIVSRMRKQEWHGQILAFIIYAYRLEKSRLERLSYLRSAAQRVLIQRDTRARYARCANEAEVQVYRGESRHVRRSEPPPPLTYGDIVG
jgi:hypothetical protein